MILESSCMLGGMRTFGGDLSWDMLSKNPSFTRSPENVVLPTVRVFMVLCLVALEDRICANAAEGLLDTRLLKERVESSALSRILRRDMARA